MDFYKTMLENMYEGIYFVDNERQITFWNKGAERITGFSASEVIGKHCFNNILNHVDDLGTRLCTQGCPLHKTIIDGEMREASVYLHHKSGFRVPVSVRTVAITENGTIIGAIEIFIDDSEKHEVLKTVEEYKALAMRDQLTELPNRRFIDSFLTSKFKEFKELGMPFGVLFMDIDHFKAVNDTYGHDIGDIVLKTVAETCTRVIRAQDLLGRYGGEEFIVAFTGIDETTLQKKAEQIRMLVEHSVLRAESYELSVTISIGGTMILDEDDLDSVLKRADTLMYNSKSSGRNRVTIG